MSEHNVEFVRKALEAFNTDGPEMFTTGAFSSPEVVFDLSRSGIPGVSVYEGAEVVKKFFEDDWFSVFPFEEWQIVVEDMVDLGDQVVALTSQKGRGASSGVEAQLKLGNLFTIKDGLIVRIEIFQNREQALAAAATRSG
jgi:hypothetical protein